MFENWQSLAAPVVVAIVAVVFLLRALRRAASKKGNCGTGCGCAGQTTKPRLPNEG